MSRAISTNGAAADGPSAGADLGSSYASTGGSVPTSPEGRRTRSPRTDAGGTERRQAARRPAEQDSPLQATSASRQARQVVAERHQRGRGVEVAVAEAGPVHGQQPDAGAAAAPSSGGGRAGVGVPCR